MGRRRKYETFDTLVGLGAGLIGLVGVATFGIIKTVCNALFESDNYNQDFSNRQISTKSRTSTKKHQSSKSNYMKKNPNPPKTAYNETELNLLHSDKQQEDFSEDAETLYRKAKELYGFKDYYQAKRYVIQALKKEPSNAMYKELLQKIKWDMSK